ncbi:MFS transporter [Halosquirtibacter laminarini]|uniref:MFS transporter n=1 Tax=Halosquirtibacter laminarini TaxID=3374600 RepID=A0AC61NGK8_9BACT|nr:MFS transporter [Prolixibacteraceae bacterium]
MKTNRNIIRFMYSISVITFMTCVVLTPDLLSLSRLFESPDAIFRSQLLVIAPAISALVVSVFWTTIRIPHQYWGKLLFLISLIVYGVTGILCYWETSFQSMFLTRLLLGFAMGLISMLLVQRGHLYLTEVKERVFVRTQGVVVGVSTMFLLLLSGWLGTYGWKYPFLIYLLAFYPVLYGMWLYIQGIGLDPRSISRPQKYFMNRKFWMIIIAAFVFVLFLTLYFLQIPFLIDRLPLTDQMQTAGLLGLLVILFILGGTFYAPVYHFASREVIYFITLGMIATGTFILGAAFDINKVFLSLLFIGVGSGLLFATAYNSVRHHIPNDVYGLWKYKLVTVVLLAQVVSPFLIYLCNGGQFVRLFFVGMAAFVVFILIVVLVISMWIKNRVSTSKA